MGGVPEADVQKVAVVPTETLVLNGPLPSTGGVRTGAARENSEVLLSGSVAVAVTNWVYVATRGNTAENEATPLASVVTKIEAMKVWPSPKPEGSALSFR